MQQRGSRSDVRVPQAVLFDLDATLVDNSGVAMAVRQTCRALATRFEMDEAELMTANAMTFRNYFPAVELDWALGNLSGRTVELETWRRTLQMVGCHDESVVAVAGNTFSVANRRAVRLYPDARDLLMQLPTSMSLAVVTNGASDSQRQKLAAVGLAERFGAVLISAEFGKVKPDPAIFVEALRRIHAEPSDAWHVGDSADADVAGANAAGLTSIWLDRSRRGRRQVDPVASFEVNCLTEVPALWSLMP